jgi:hypothetical protein
MLGVFFADVIISTVIEYEAAGDGTGLMREESWSVGRLDVAIFAEVEDKVVIGKNSCLRETIHAFGEIEVDKSINGQDLSVQ